MRKDKDAIKKETLDLAVYIQGLVAEAVGSVGIDGIDAQTKRNTIQMVSKAIIKTDNKLSESIDENHRKTVDNFAILIVEITIEEIAKAIKNIDATEPSQFKEALQTTSIARAAKYYDKASKPKNEQSPVDMLVAKGNFHEVSLKTGSAYKLCVDAVSYCEAVTNGHVQAAKHLETIAKSSANALALNEANAANSRAPTKIPDQKAVHVEQEKGFASKIKDKLNKVLAPDGLAGQQTARGGHVAQKQARDAESAQKIRGK